jgi:hypothetical protein
MAKIKADVVRTLYFIRSFRPTPEQMEEAAALRGVVSFRNALKVHPEDALEPFDALLGDIPPQYQAALDEKALTGDGEAVPEPVTPFPPEGSALLPRQPAAPPLQRPAAAAAWTPNA